MILFEYLFFGYVAYITSYVFFFGFGGHLYKRRRFSSSSEKLRFAILIPGYKEDPVILSTVEQNLSIGYPKNFYDLYVIADSFLPETLRELSKLDCQIIDVQFEKSTKVKALKKALEGIDADNYDYLVILDADNVVEEAYLEKVNYYLKKKKIRALQTQRIPKNYNNDLARLDGISEAINNHIYRQGASATGFSASLNGSGMVFDFLTFKDTIREMDSVGGFDRELEFRLLEKGVKVEYLKEAWVYDEKTDDDKTFQNQRKRWISSQYVYLRRYFYRGVKALLKGDIVYFHSTVWRNIQLPRLINVGLITVIAVLTFVLRDFLQIGLIYWIALWLLFVLSTLISIPKSYFNSRSLTAILKLPFLLITMIKLMFKLKGANKKYIHTPHRAK